MSIIKKTTAMLLFATMLTINSYAALVNGTVNFKIKNLGLTVTGNFGGPTGTVNFNPANLAESSFNVNVDATSISTGNGTRDKHLKAEEYFDVEKFKTINFTSTKITSLGNNKYNVLGNLTLKGLVKAISFDFISTKTATGNDLSGEFVIDRRTFKVGGKSLVLGDKVTIMIKANTK